MNSNEEIEIQHKIDLYLSNTMSESERLSFEEQMESNADLKEMVLLQKSIGEVLFENEFDHIKDDEIEPDFVSALKLCKRRRIGPLRPDENRELFYKKDMGILARGGFSFDLSKRVPDKTTVDK